MSAILGVARTRRNKAMIEVVCVEEVPYPTQKKTGNKQPISQFTNGGEYIAQLKRSGNYALENNAGHEVSFTPEQFTKHFKEAK